jgi:hypothetical protein
MAYEDFTTYTEVDSGDDIDVTASRITFTTITENAVSWVVKDKEANHFSTDFSHLVEVKSTAEVNGVLAICMLANMIGTVQDIADASEDSVFLFLNWGTADFRLLICNAGSFVALDDSLTINLNTQYYITSTVDIDGGTNGTGRWTIYIRMDSHTGTLFDTITGDMPAGWTWDFQYLHAISSRDDTPGDTVSGYIENLDLQEAAAYNITYINGIDITTISKVFGVTLADIQSINGIDVLQS